MPFKITRYPDRSTVALVALLFVASYFLFAGGSGTEYVPRSIRELWNLGHIVYFAILVLLLRRVKALDRLSLAYQWTVLIAMTLVLGTLVEISQMGSLREPDWMDVSRDLMGCLLVLAFSPIKRQPGAHWPELLRYVVGVLLLLHLVPFGVALMDESFARKQYPVLADFETPFERTRWSGNSSREIVQLNATSGLHQMRVVLNTDRYSSASLIHLNGDWQEFESLVIRVYQPEQGYLPITLRIHDQQHEQGPSPFEHHDRFHRKFMLSHGWNDLVIPLYAVEAAPRKRNMDLSRIRNLMLFTVRLPQPRILYLESVFLSPQ